MIKVGLTGGIASGKSVVAKVLQQCSIPVFDSDKVAKELVENSPLLKANIITLLGAESYLKNGKYNKPFVAAKVFEDSKLLKSLNSLIHPLVAQSFKDWCLLHHSSKIVVKEAALMNKSKDLDKIIVVSCPRNLRIERIKLRDPQRSNEQIEAIFRNQKSEVEFLKMADYVIYNDEKQLVLPQLIKILEGLSN